LNFKREVPIVRRFSAFLILILFALPLYAAENKPTTLAEAEATVQADRVAIGVADAKIAEAKTALDAAVAKAKATIADAESGKAKAVKALEAHRGLLRKLWQDLMGDDVPLPTPPGPTPTPTPPTPPGPTPPPEAKAVAHYAWVVEDVSKRQPWQEAVDVWAEENLNSDAATQFRRDDLLALKKCATCTWVVNAVAGKALPCLVIIGDLNGKPSQLIYCGSEPQTVDAWKKLWLQKGGVL
jgi:hypothetical protein